ncbi:type II toxin-antitoxin system ParD family antitoxin [Arsukibacterium sp.]|uniref:type II toxin-antitoxin system ParD family antitoxin n=1 Tax=Arsukibacterium sp. TaxID=1977258 RepID=UPI001BD1F789|nr:type II toxin-antitoxin system ParD family antitoxin [Arsukibacterium sp.]
MNISLGAEFEKRINEKLASGLYTSASEVIRDALRLLFEKDLEKQQQLELLKQEVLRGAEQLAAGKKSSKTVLDIFAEVEQSVNG